MRSSNSSLICILVGLSSVLKVDLFWLWFGRKMSKKKKGKIPHLCFMLDTSSPRQRSARLGKGQFA